MAKRRPRDAGRGALPGSARPGRGRSIAPGIAPGLVVSMGWLAPAPAMASADGAEWATAADPMGCTACHFDSPAPTAKELTIEGLPDRLEAGRTYSLTLVLKNPALRTAGFLLSVEAAGEPAGELRAADGGGSGDGNGNSNGNGNGNGEIETQGALARQSRDGSVAPAPGLRRWQLDWTAPAVIEAPVVFSLWGNAGNDDLSPFGDAVHHRVWQVPAAP